MHRRRQHCNKLPKLVVHANRDPIPPSPQFDADDSISESNQIRKKEITTESITSSGGAILRINVDPTIVSVCEAERKGLVNLRARYALAGFVLVEISDGSLLATRWNRTRQLQDVSAALHFLRQIGGAK